MSGYISVSVLGIEMPQHWVVGSRGDGGCIPNTVSSSLLYLVVGYPLDVIKIGNVMLSMIFVNSHTHTQAYGTHSSLANRILLLIPHTRYMIRIDEMYSLFFLLRHLFSWRVAQIFLIHDSLMSTQRIVLKYLNVSDFLRTSD